MYDGFKVVAVIPAGRQRTMSLLMKYLDLEHRKGILDGCQIWVNTLEESDLRWLHNLPKAYDWVECIEPIGDWEEPKQRNTGKFYAHTVEHDTIYVRFDDDIIYFEEDALKNLLEFRRKNPQYFVIFAQIWNNAIISYLQQQAGHIDESAGVVLEPYCMDPVGWDSPAFGVHVHEVLLGHIENGTVRDLFVEPYPLDNAHRFSVSCFAFYGKHMDRLINPRHNPVPGMPQGDEEVWLTEIIPRHFGWRNVIAGNAVVSHFTFFTQREAILKTDILERYVDVSIRRHSAGYYDMMPVTGEPS